MNQTANGEHQMEPIINPELPIIDAHHHLWPVSPLPEFAACGPDEFAADIANCGHRIVGTVYVEGHTAYRASAPVDERSIGETEYAVTAANRYPPQCSAIVAFTDLRLGKRVEELLDRHVEASEGRLRGIRMVAAVDPDLGNMPGFARLLDDPQFRAGLSLLPSRGLVFDVWIVQPQLDTLAELADALPDVTFVLGHLGGPLGIGRHAPPFDAFSDWRSRIDELAVRPNIVVKLGGLSMPTTGLAPAPGEPRQTSAEMAEVQRPYIETAIALFQPERCMFESNFPVDRMATDYRTLWNVYKRITADFSEAERSWLFSKTALNIYRMSTTP